MCYFFFIQLYFYFLRGSFFFPSLYTSLLGEEQKRKFRCQFIRKLKMKKKKRNVAPPDALAPQFFQITGTAFKKGIGYQRENLFIAFKKKYSIVQLVWCEIFSFQSTYLCLPLPPFLCVFVYSEQVNDNNGLEVYTLAHAFTPYIAPRIIILCTQCIYFLLFSFHSHPPLYFHAHFHIALIHLFMKAIAW